VARIALADHALVSAEHGQLTPSNPAKGSVEYNGIFLGDPVASYGVGNTLAFGSSEMQQTIFRSALLSNPRRNAPRMACGSQ
jgi:hypothetical protein